MSGFQLLHTMGDTEKAMLVEDDHEDMSSDEEETNKAKEGAAALLKVGACARVLKREMLCV